jgi:hypothetical protein
MFAANRCRLFVPLTGAAIPTNRIRRIIMKMLRRLIPLLLLAFPLRAQQWSATGGPEGADIIAMAASGTTVLAVAGPGVIYRNGEREWQRVAELGARRIDVAGDVFIATGPDALYRSTDRGEHWIAIGPQGLGINAVTDGNNVYARVDSTLYRSTDLGLTWKPIVTSGIVSYSFIVRDSTILAGQVEGGIFRSTDLGATWSRVTVGLPEGAAPIAFHRRADAFIVSFDQRGVYRSPDGGLTWNAINEGLTLPAGRIPALFVFTSAGDQLWGTGPEGTFAYVGGRWRVQSLDQDRALAWAGGRIYRGSRRGITTTTDTGKAWRATNDGLRGHRVDAIARYGSGVLVGAAGVIHRTMDDGASWIVATGIDVSRFAVAGGVAYAVGRSFTGEGIFRTVDGLDWGRTTDLPGPVHWVRALAARGDTLWAGVAHIGYENNQEIWADGGIYRSTDRGATWSVIDAGLPNDGHGDVPVRDIIPLDGALLAQTDDGLYRSTDGGEMWSRVHPVSLPSNLRGISASAGDTAWVVIGEEVYVSRDAGSTWAPAGNALPDEPGITSLSLVRGVLHASTASEGTAGRLFRLVNGAWQDVSGQIPVGVRITSIVELPTKALAATVRNSVWSIPLGQVASVPSRDDIAGAPGLAVRPNPLTGAGAVSFDLPAAGHVRLTLLSPLGDDVALLRDEVMSAGAHAVAIDPAGLAAGVYRARLTCATGTFTVPFVNMR